MLENGRCSETSRESGVIEHNGSSAYNSLVILIGVIQNLMAVLRIRVSIAATVGSCVLKAWTIAQSRT